VAVARDSGGGRGSEVSAGLWRLADAHAVSFRGGVVSLVLPALGGPCHSRQPGHAVESDADRFARER